MQGICKFGYHMFLIIEEITKFQWLAKNLNLYVHIWYFFQEHYYNPITHHGFIEFRLQQIRLSFSPSKKAYQSRKRKAAKESSSKQENPSSSEKLLRQDELNQKVRHKSCSVINSDAMNILCSLSFLKCFTIVKTFNH